MKALPEKKWAKADAAYARGVQAYIEWGRELAKIDATQEEIAARYDKSQEQIAYALAVGRDKRLISATYKPKSEYSLYLLTTLDDKGFKELCKPTTTQADIKEYKRRLEPPAAPLRTERDQGDNRQKAKAEPEKYHKSMREINETLKEKLQSVPKADWPTRDFLADCEELNTAWHLNDIVEKFKGLSGVKLYNAYRIMGLPAGLRPEIYEFVFRGYRSKYNTDRPGSGDNEVMQLLNQAMEIIREHCKV